MNNLIKVETTNERPTVTGRDLHEFLEIGTPYSKWFSRMIEYGFIENVDYVKMSKNVIRVDGTEMPQIQTDHQLTLGMAKEISMIQRNEKGKQARLYFIECEEKLKQQTPQLPTTYKEALLALIAAEEEKERLQLETQKQQLQIEEMTPKANFTDRLLKSKDNILVREYSKILQDEGFTLGEKKLYKWFRDNKYLMKNNEPYQQYMKYFAVIESTINTLWGEKIVKTTKINPQGQLFFYLKLEEEFMPYGENDVDIDNDIGNMSIDSENDI
jgi:anti-repressor protein